MDYLGPQFLRSFAEWCGDSKLTWFHRVKAVEIHSLKVESIDQLARLKHLQSLAIHGRAEWYEKPQLEQQFPQFAISEGTQLVGQALLLNRRD